MSASAEPNRPSEVPPSLPDVLLHARAAPPPAETPLSAPPTRHDLLPAAPPAEEPPPPGQLWPDTVPPAGPAPLPPQGPMPRQASHYLLEEEIGRGGMGVVFRATDAAFHRTLAVKVLLADPGAQPELERR